MSDTPQSGADLLARIKPQLKEDRIQLCLRPDLIEAWEEASTRLQEQQVADSASPRLADAGTSKTAKKLAAEVQRIEEEIEAHAAWFHFRAMPKDKWRALCDNHPPRAGDQFDMMAGYNRDVVLDEMVRACLFDPVFDEESWAEFIAVCNPSEWAELRGMVNAVNQSVVDVPKSVLASRILPKRASGSVPLASGE